MEKVIALAGNPNVGKSTLFNTLTGMNQHTGNWAGKTVELARGESKRGDTTFYWVDLPGCYSLLAHSEEEETARDFICFEHPDAVVVVCDATCLERNMNLVLQVLETTHNVVLCVNLLDEARKKKIKVDLLLLSKRLGIPVAGTAARNGEGLEKLFESIETLDSEKLRKTELLEYPKPLEEAIQKLEKMAEKEIGDKAKPRWVCVRLLEENESFAASMKKYWGKSVSETQEVKETLKSVWKELKEQGYEKEEIRDAIAETFVKASEKICKDAVIYEDRQYDKKDRKLDWLFTSKKTGFPIMFFMLLLIFWITISGANIPSSLLSEGFFWLEERLVELAVAVHIPKTIYDPVIFGIYRVLAWVISVMLPPMAIFFPLFTILENFGYLPRVAFNLDRCFQRCCACGKQALTMCMGFGCNAVGVTGCRIIDSPRERMIAIVTNSFVPCNGRFPTILTMITIFLAGNAAGMFSGFFSAFLLASVILFGVGMTLLVSKLLSKTILKGMPSSFTLELPPYRMPQIGKVIVRSIFDRTLFVLGRAVAVAAPAGLLIWFMANITVADKTLLRYGADFFDPFARLLGLDGTIFIAFLLGMPANEIVVPVMLMAYLAQGNLINITDATVMRQLLTQQGWTWITAVSTILFSLMHWPCATTCLTIKKETKSLKWMIISMAVPTVMGIIVCFLFATTARWISGIF